ncbi:MAG: major capsid protein [Oscillospiraceae bacterium]|nr:major capsid protein [Oscillospiraceae bacterium]
MSIDYFSTYMLRAAVEEIQPEKFFFRDRYFPTTAADIFNTDKVLVEYKKGNRKIAAFVSDRSNPIPLERTGYKVHEFEPPKISMSRSLTIDDLKKRGFGEAIYSNTTPAERAVRLMVNDFTDLDLTISRREEWMCAQTMINNGCTVQEYVDAKTKGAAYDILFYEGDSSPHIYTVGIPWNSKGANVIGDIHAMCRLLAMLGLNAADLVIGTDVEDVFYQDESIARMLDKNSGIVFGEINERIDYPGIATLGNGPFNIKGFKLRIFVASTTYENENGVNTPYFPKDGAMVSFPKCGHLMYGRDTHIPYGQKDPVDFTGKRIPKLIIDQKNDVRELDLISHPLAVPAVYCPYIFAGKVVS